MSVVVTILLLAGFLAVPSSFGERGLEISIDEVYLDAPQGPSGEYPVGEHKIIVVVKNTGDEVVDYIHFNVTVTNATSTVYEHLKNSSIASFVPSVWVNIEFPGFQAEEGDYTIHVNATAFNTSFGHTFKIITDRSIRIMDYPDLSLKVSSPEEGASLPLGDPVAITLNVTNRGNVPMTGPYEVNVKISDLFQGHLFYNQTVMALGERTLQPGESVSVALPSFMAERATTYVLTATGDFSDMVSTDDTDTITFQIQWISRPSIKGYVTDRSDNPVPGALVEAISESEVTYSNTTDENGYYELWELPEGNYTLRVSAHWFMEKSFEGVEITPIYRGFFNVTLRAMDVGDVDGYVMDTYGEPVVGALVEVVGYPHNTTTDEDGYYVLENIQTGYQLIQVTASGYRDQVLSVTVLYHTVTTLNFTLEELLPFTISVTPPNGSENVSVVDPVVIEFSSQMDPESVNQTSVYLMKEGGYVVLCNYTWEDNYRILFLEPVGGLEYETHYTLVIMPTIRDSEGREPLKEVFRSHFTTIKEPVRVIETYPSYGQANVPLQVTIWAVFSDDIDSTTVNDENVKLSYGAGLYVPCTVQYIPSERRVVITPQVELQPQTTYSVILRDTIKSLSGAPFPGYVWDFTTKAVVSTGSVTGTVYGPDNQPISGALVELSDDRGFYKQTTSDPNGRFEFQNVAPGEYTLTISYGKDYQKVKKTVTVTAGETTDMGSLTLKEKVETKPVNMVLVGALLIILLVIILGIGYSLLRRPREYPEEYEAPARGPSYRPVPPAPRGAPPGVSAPPPSAPRVGMGALERPAAGAGGYGEAAYLEEEFACPVCGSPVGITELYCPVCGAEFEPNVVACPECGSNIPAEAKVCPVCGTEFGEELEEEVEVLPPEEFEIEEEEEVEVPEELLEEELEEEEGEEEEEEGSGEKGISRGGWR